MIKRSISMKFLGIMSVTFFFVVTLVSAGQAKENRDAIIGKWLSSDKDAIIQIYERDSKYFGKIIWLKDPLNDNGKPQTDVNNPDPKLRNRQIMGLVILRDLVYDKDNLWSNGMIYDPDSGDDYNCKMSLKDNNTLELRGYVGFPLFGRTEVWTRKRDSSA
jgi:uncharacterized protein (DUF2147 family)